jgi:hypothetical protein
MEHSRPGCVGERPSRLFRVSGKRRRWKAEEQSTRRKTQRKSDKGMLGNGMLDKGMPGWSNPATPRWRGRIGFQPVMENGLPACSAPAESG